MIGDYHQVKVYRSMIARNDRNRNQFLSALQTSSFCQKKIKVMSFIKKRFIDFITHAVLASVFIHGKLETINDFIATNIILVQKLWFLA